MRTVTLLSLLLVCTLVLASDDYKTWSKDHANAKTALLRVLDNHEKAKEFFMAWEEDAPDQPRELVDFLAEKGDRNVSDFLDKVGKDGKALRKLHTDYPEAVRGFRQWVRDNPNAAHDLTKLKKPFKWLSSGGEVGAEPERKKKKKDK